MDPNNPVIKLCVEGMQAEAAGRNEDAHNLFMQAWEACTDDFEACVAAHYVARHQSPEDALHWNQVALARAEAVGDKRVQGFYPSLYLNLGHSYEVIGNVAEAKRHYELAAERVGDLAADPYGNTVRKGIEAGRRRIRMMEQP